MQRYCLFINNKECEGKKEWMQDEIWYCKSGTDFKNPAGSVHWRTMLFLV